MGFDPDPDCGCCDPNLPESCGGYFSTACDVLPPLQINWEITIPENTGLPGGADCFPEFQYCGTAPRPVTSQGAYECYWYKNLYPCVVGSTNPFPSGKPRCCNSVLNNCENELSKLQPDVCEDADPGNVLPDAMNYSIWIQLIEVFDNGGGDYRFTVLFNGKFPREVDNQTYYSPIFAPSDNLDCSGEITIYTSEASADAGTAADAIGTLNWTGECSNDPGEVDPADPRFPCNEDLTTICAEIVDSGCNALDGEYLFSDWRVVNNGQTIAGYYDFESTIDCGGGVTFEQLQLHFTNPNAGSQRIMLYAAGFSATIYAWQNLNVVFPTDCAEERTLNPDVNTPAASYVTILGEDCPSPPEDCTTNGVCYDVDPSFPIVVDLDDWTGTCSTCDYDGTYTFSTDNRTDDSEAITYISDAYGSADETYCSASLAVSGLPDCNFIGGVTVSPDTAYIVWRWEDDQSRGRIYFLLMGDKTVSGSPSGRGVALELAGDTTVTDGDCAIVKDLDCGIVATAGTYDAT